MITPGLTSITFRQLDPEAIVDLAAACGLKAIEWGGDVHARPGDTARARRVRAATRDAGLVVSSYGSYYRVRVGRERDASFDAVLDTASALGAPMVRVWAGTRGSADVPHDARRRIADDLRRVSTLAEARGVRVGVEFHADTLTDTDASAAELIREVARPNCTLYWQPHNGVAPEQAGRGLTQLLPSVSNVHVFEWRVAGGAIVRLPLASGAAHWRGYLSTIARSCVDRFALIEFVVDDRPEQLREDARALLDWLGDLEAPGTTGSKGPRNKQEAKRDQA